MGWPTNSQLSDLDKIGQANLRSDERLVAHAMMVLRDYLVESSSISKPLAQWTAEDIVAAASGGRLGSIAGSGDNLAGRLDGLIEELQSIRRKIGD